MTDQTRQEARGDKACEISEIAKEFGSSCGVTCTDISISCDKQDQKKSAVRKKVKKATKRKIKVPPSWPGVIPATKRAGKGNVTVCSPVRKRAPN